MKKYHLYLICFLLNISVNAQVLTGKIIRVSDGDTIILLDSVNVQHKIRLYGIDCPEKKQDYGTKAADFTKGLCAGKNVTVEIEGTDIYGRILGIVYAGKVNINEELLKNGLAWRYKHNKSMRYLELENQARKNELNIWSMKNPIAPWNFRKKK
ncbi:thermonuclease family protein [Dysgonomonas sp. GY75]|uniref:thermonuclease family protein n=1 Tax=Dysgonomonas sp. GY75 TaxID=2780419 RepID=UPI001883B9AC|nr:thermonuclease family protein [Dysgonomonas sp. GY75]MBF0651283.1 thermonuclease family protein [Dysgonomonas sp. GY75]